jgi:hypothetical protein
MDLSLLIPDSVLLAATAAAVLAALSVYGLWTSGTWLPRFLGALDRFLTRIRFGQYSARFLTWMEDWFGEKWGRKGGAARRKE